MIPALYDTILKYLCVNALWDIKWSVAVQMSPRMHGIRLIPAGYTPGVTGDITCAEMWQDMSGGHILELCIITVFTCSHVKQTWLDEPRACWMAVLHSEI